MLYGIMVLVIRESRRVFFARFLVLLSSEGAIFLLDVGWGHRHQQKPRTKFRAALRRVNTTSLRRSHFYPELTRATT